MKKAFSKKNLWEKSPTFVKNIVGGVLKYVPLSVLMGGEFRKWYRFVQDAQWWDTERYRSYQFERLKNILTIAYNQTDFYHNLFKEIGFEPGDFKRLEDITLLPTIDKETVRENLESMMTVSPKNSNVDYVTTSGTGGKPLCFYMDSSRHAVEFAHLASSWGRVGYHVGDSMAVLRGKSIPINKTGMYYQHDPLLQHHLYSTFYMSHEQMSKYVHHMHKVAPKYLHAYPSAAYTLSRFMHQESMQFPSSLRAILLESEPDYPQQKEFIEDNFHIQIFSSYGHTEKLVLASYCEKNCHYHVWPTYGFCEILNSKGENAVQGEMGEIVGTGFINEVVPFIRYRTDDYAKYVGNSCNECGRHHLILEHIRGHRTQEFLIAHDNRIIIAWTALNMHDDTFDGITKFQFIQEKPGFAELQMVPARDSTKYDLERIRKHLKGKLNGLVDVKLVICDDIVNSKSGKQTIVLQRIPGIDNLLKEYET